MSARIILLALAGLSLGGCFDGPEEIEGLKCSQDDHCPGNFRCVQLGIDVDLDGINDAECQEIADCVDTDVGCASSATTMTTDPSLSTTDPSTTATTASTSAESACAPEGGSCANGEFCCSGTCADSGAGYVCSTTCSSGIECGSTCCCASGLDYDGYTTQVCTSSTSICGQEASCAQPGVCSSPGSLCYSDGDCCGGRCVPNGSGITQCFKTCFAPTECVSGCCVNHPELGTSLCEAC